MYHTLRATAVYVRATTCSIYIVRLLPRYLATRAHAPRCHLLPDTMISVIAMEVCLSAAMGWCMIPPVVESAYHSHSRTFSDVKFDLICRGCADWVCFPPLLAVPITTHPPFSLRCSASMGSTEPRWTEFSGPLTWTAAVAFTTWSSWRPP